MLHSLEPRRHFSVSHAQLTPEGVLDIVGTDARSATDVRASDVRSIRIVCGAGNDSILLGKITQPTQISTGGGDDSVFGSLGNDAVNLGTGNDRFYGRGGSDSIRGGAGNDAIYSGWDESEAYVKAQPSRVTPSFPFRVSKRDEAPDWLDAGSGKDFAALTYLPQALKNAERFPIDAYMPATIRTVSALEEYGPHGAFAWREDGKDYIGVSAMWGSGAGIARFSDIVRDGNTFSIDATAFYWTGAATQALQSSQRTYDVGELPRGVYRVVVRQDGQEVFRHEFEVTGSKWAGKNMVDHPLGSRVGASD
jgi:Ca2+-binding RTX toxin-like protein